MSTNKIDWSVPQRLSPVALIFILGKIIKDSWPLVLIVVGRIIINEQNDEKRNTSIGIYFILGITLLILFIHLNQLINFFLFRIQIKGTELVVTGGLLSKSKTIVPLNRVQSVHLIENYLHKLTNTCTIKIETAGSDATEIEVKAINKEKALSLQSLLQNSVTEISQKNIPEQVQIMGIQFADVIKLAISENHVRTFLIIIAFAYSRLEDIKQLIGFDASDIIDQQVDNASFSLSGLLTLLLIGLIITLWVSFIRVMLRYHEMKITANNKGFQMEWGFLQTQQKMLIQNKVQLISWNFNFVRKVLGISILRFFMMGENLTQTKQHIQLPVMDQHLLYQLISPYQAVLPSSNTQSYSTHISYGWRNTLLFVLPIILVISTAIYFWNPWYILFLLLLLIYLAISNWVKYQKFKYWFNETTIQIQKGVWGVENILLNFNKIQHVMVKTSPFLRRKKLATVELHTAGETIVIPYISIEQAQYLVDLSLVNVEFH
ncbi:PH domain-containing protein [Sediminibacterium sp.]|uniref:PH domain-containing protein n=1 Tax=Sediminibacterium sp. TaxID=1917865 RepID=UPI0025F8A080|nr:PH domain-containing protein [Sediminibacterium sp.]MBT9483145.1 PH domain-containing protein [Sediminibacterium sp.]